MAGVVTVLGARVGVPLAQEVLLCIQTGVEFLLQRGVQARDAEAVEAFNLAPTLGQLPTTLQAVDQRLPQEREIRNPNLAHPIRQALGNQLIRNCCAMAIMSMAVDCALSLTFPIPRIPSPINEAVRLERTVQVHALNSYVWCVND